MKSLKKVQFLSVIFFILFLLFFSLSSVHAASNIVVNDLGDNTIAGDGKCTLREAIINAYRRSDVTNGDCAPGSTENIISFSLSGTMSLGSDFPYTEIALLTIDGTGQHITINGNGHQIFSLNTRGVTYTLNNLTLINGSAP